MSGAVKKIGGAIKGGLGGYMSGGKAGAAMGAAGGMMSGKGAREQARGARGDMRAAAAMFDPWRVRSYIQQTNPLLAQAAFGQSPFGSGPAPSNLSGWLDHQARLGPEVQANRLGAMFHMPGYIDPRVMNFSNRQAMQGQDTALRQAGAALGRANFSGGLADAYQFARRAKTQEQKGRIFQDYSMARENLARQDIQMGQSLLNQNIGNAMGAAGGQANILAGMPQMPSRSSMYGQMIGTGLQAYGAFKGMGQGQQSTRSPSNFFTPRDQFYGPGGAGRSFTSGGLGQGLGNASGGFFKNPYAPRG